MSCTSIILQDIEFLWKNSDINTVKNMWRNGNSLKSISNEVKREGDEVFLLLIHLSRQGYIKKREGHIWGNECEK